MRLSEQRAHKIIISEGWKIPLNKKKNHCYLLKVNTSTLVRDKIQ